MAWPTATPRYLGVTSVASYPSRASVGGSAPSTSARPPVLEKGTASDPMIRICGRRMKSIVSSRDCRLRVVGNVESICMSERPIRAPRAEPREVVELKQLKVAQPELASAVDMQLALVEVQRRVQSR